MQYRQNFIPTILHVLFLSTKYHLRYHSESWRPAFSIYFPNQIVRPPDAAALLDVPTVQILHACTPLIRNKPHRSETAVRIAALRLSTNAHFVGFRPLFASLLA